MVDYSPMFLQNQKKIVLDQKTLEKRFEIDPNTKKINLESKGIVSVEKLSLPNLEKLNLSHNHIEKLKFLDYLPNLKELNLKNNKIIEIPKSICKLQKLKKMNLCGNEIENFENLKGLSIKRLEIDVENEEDIINLLPNLKYLNGNKIGKNSLKVDNLQVEIESFKGEKSKIKKEPVKGVHVKMEKNRDGYVDFEKSGLVESKKVSNEKKKSSIHIFKEERIDTW